MDRHEKRIVKLSRQLVDIERTLRRIENIVVYLYEHRYSEPNTKSRPPPKVKIVSRES